jgi:hypothetical protein
MRKTVLVLAVLGSLACLALGIVWQGQVDSSLGQAVSAFAKEVNSGKSDAELEKQYGPKYKELKDELNHWERAKKAPILLMIAAPLAIAGAVLAFKGFGLYAGPLLLIIGIVPAIFFLKSLVPTSLLLVAGGLSFTIGSPEKKQTKKKKKQRDEDDEDEEAPPPKKRKRKEQDEEIEETAEEEEPEEEAEEIEDAAEEEEQAEEEPEEIEEEPEEEAPPPPRKAVKKPVAAAPTGELVTRIQCPKCKAALKVVDPEAGIKMNCPKCRFPIPITKAMVANALAAQRAAREASDADEDDDEKPPPKKAKKKG